VACYLWCMKKSITPLKLTLNRETLKLLKGNSLNRIVGGGPTPTLEVACPEHTAKVDCG